MALDRIVLVRQYRPPLKGWTIEMPAGLVDQGEDQATAAVRELKEETGYSGTAVRGADPVIVSDPGLTNANFQMVEISIDGDASENQLVRPAEEDANIETVVLPLTGLKARLDGMLRVQEQTSCCVEFIRDGTHVDSRLYHFAVGLDYASRRGAN